MSKVLTLNKRFQEILSLEIEKNDILMQSEFKDFALSEDMIFEGAMEKYLQEISKAVIEDINESIVYG